VDVAGLRGETRARTRVGVRAQAPSANARGSLLGALLACSLLAALVSSGAASARTYQTPPHALAVRASESKAPKVTKQPVAASVEEGQNATFSVAGSGTPTPSVEWQISRDGGASWSTLAGVITTQLTIEDARGSENGYEYRAVFANTAGEVTTNAAVLTVRALPLVTSQPLSATVEAGAGATFEASASGSPPPTVQWELSTNGGNNWSTISGATSDRLVIASVKTTESGHEYRATFKNLAGKATSEAAMLTVRSPPLVTRQPLAVTVQQGQSASFEAAASGFPTPGVQWQISTDAGASWSNITGANSDTLTIASSAGSESADEFRAVFTNAAGEAVTNAATLTVHAAPTITRQPLGATVEEGQEAIFEAAATGSPTPTVQWELSSSNGASWSAIEGASSERLRIPSVLSAESGHQFRAVFTNAVGKATSEAVTLTAATHHYSAVAWGQNLFRQLGDGTTNAFSDVPVTVSGLRFVSAVAAGGRHSLALLAGGTVVAWGSNEAGQLGDGGTTTSNVPVAVSGLSGVKAIAAGGEHSLALLTNGTVMGWGGNESGQLGTGTIKASEVPVAVKGLTGVKAIAAGAGDSLALLTNGTVMAWGGNEIGQLGTGNLRSSTVPVAVKGLTGVTAIAAGGDFSLALLSDGTVEAWGSDEYGQLANASAEEEGFSDTPVRVGALTGVTAVTAGAEHGLALLADHTVVAWGADADGQLGNGKLQSREEAPAPVSGLAGVSAIAAGSQDSVALLTNGSVVAWGANEWGSLGDGVTGAPSDAPVPVSGLGTVVGVSAGGEQMLAYGEPIPTIAVVSPQFGPAGGGATVTLTGVNFTGASAVRFGTSAATSFTVTSPTSISAVSPPGKGIVDITVTTVAGTSPSGPIDRYTYRPPPVLTKLSSKTGAGIGGTSVTLTGKELAGASDVMFGQSAATSFTVNSPTSITAVSPPGVVGTVDVTVTTPGGVSALSSKDRFGYTPTITGVSPSSGAGAGGTTVTVTGFGFALGTNATTLKFAKKKAKTVDCETTTSCTVIVPPAVAGTVDVTATVEKLTSPIAEPADEYTYG
jgi:alpha-tubulin suppressor-like RCC1 family protein